MHTDAGINIDAHRRTHTDAGINGHTHTYNCRDTHRCGTKMHTHVNLYRHSYTHTNTDTRAHMQTHINLDTHVHTDTQHQGPHRLSRQSRRTSSLEEDLLRSLDSPCCLG